MSDDPREECYMCDEDSRSECKYCQGTGYTLGSQDAPVCPHCGAVQSTDELYTTTDIQCDECDGWMECEVNYTPDYSTGKTDPPEIKHLKRMEEAERQRAQWEAEKAARMPEDRD